jgi:hypothetical protein
MTEFRTSFDIDRTPAEAWKVLERLRAERVDPDAGAETWWLPAFETTGTATEVDPERGLTVRKDTEPCAGTTISITFEHVESGAHITIVQSGFDEAFIEGAGEGFRVICEQLAADLQLWFARGVVGGRSGRPWTPIGCAVRPSGLGLEVTDVWAGTWAARAGLRPGDVLVTVGGAPIVNERDLITVQRVFGPGTDVAATWARADELLEATGPV